MQSTSLGTRTADVPEAARPAAEAHPARGVTGLLAPLRRALAMAVELRRRNDLTNEKFTDALERELVRRAQGLDERRDGW
jgi:hypothetical protein